MSTSLNVVSCCAPIPQKLQVQVRNAQSDDLASVTELLESASLPTEGVTDRFPQSYAVATYGDVIVGVAGVEIYGSDGLLRSVAVNNARRGFGVGVQLVRDRLQWARDQKLRDVYLLTTTASAFFDRLGFEQMDRAAAPAEMQQSPEFSELCPSTSTAMKMNLADGADIRAMVRERYSAAARAGGTSLGCGNPTALAQLAEGETVLDLGSGGGFDVLQSAKRVGPSGKAYGLDMTDEMLELARANQAKAGATNVEFLKGEIEQIPLPDESVDVVISNCVINLAADKSKVLREAYRVLKPGGRFAVSDVVTRGEMPEIVRRNSQMWTACLAGALEEAEYVRLLRGAGFEGVELEATDSDFAEMDGAFMSAFVRARKPARP